MTITMWKILAAAVCVVGAITLAVAIIKKVKKGK